MAILFRAFIFKVLFVTHLLGISALVSTETKVVVIPIFGEQASDIKNVVTVAKTGGDFTDPVAAMDSIKDASASNPYLLAVGPGIFELSEVLVVKPHVNVAGSGQRATILTSTDAGPSVTVSLTGIASGPLIQISGMTVRNASGGVFCTALSGYDGHGVLVKDVVLEAVGCTGQNTAIDMDTGSPELDNVIIKALGGQRAIGVYLGLGGLFSVNHSQIQVAGGSEYSAGFLGFDGWLQLRDSNVEVGSGPTQGVVYGIKHNSQNFTQNFRAQIINSTIMAESTATVPGNSYGVHGINGYELDVRRSTVSGGTASIYLDASSNVNVSTSTLIGSASGGAGNSGVKQCVTTDNGSGDLLDGNCALVP